MALQCAVLLAYCKIDSHRQQKLLTEEVAAEVSSRSSSQQEQKQQEQKQQPEADSSIQKQRPARPASRRQPEAVVERQGCYLGGTFIIPSYYPGITFILSYLV